MKSYEHFKKETGLALEQLAKVTGYTRQGLHHAFKMMDQGKKPSNQFLICIDAALRRKMEDEMRQFNQKIDRIKEIQNYMNELREG